MTTPTDSTPGPDPAPMTNVTVEVPAHRVAQFQRFHERFLQMAAAWDAQVGNEDLRGRRGRGRHHGRCRGHREASSQA